MRFITILIFLCLIGVSVGFGALAMWTMPKPEERIEKTIENQRFFGTEDEDAGR
jgi:hypothetical protein